MIPFFLLANNDDDGFDLIKPSLIQQLRTILDQYPDDGQILKVWRKEGYHNQFSEKWGEWVSVTFRQPSSQLVLCDRSARPQVKYHNWVKKIPVYMLCSYGTMMHARVIRSFHLCVLTSYIFSGLQYFTSWNVFCCIRSSSKMQRMHMQVM